MRFRRDRHQILLARIALLVRMINECVKRCSLGFFPTPLTEMKRLSQQLGGPHLWIKRDDLTGLALGGNKTRKLEFLLAEAVAQGCDTMVTAGAAQSNHCRQTAAAASALGLSCHLALGGLAPGVANGNLLLDELFGATIHWSGRLRKGEALARIEKELCSRGLRPYVIPYGGSNPLGAVGFASAMIELNEQLAAGGLCPKAIVFASSSGGTHAGLLVGASMTENPAQIIGIEIDKRQADEEPFDEFISRLANQTAELLNVRARYQSSDVVLRKDYLGGGYGVMGDLERDAIKLMATCEGILLDPVYTGRAFGALVDLIRQGEFSSHDQVIFWHTGGVPALFSYAESLTGASGRA
jgi:D-cysteine desulfhydrase family pyridoxal phosphate-dependent enzyme